MKTDYYFVIIGKRNQFQSVQSVLSVFLKFGTSATAQNIFFGIDATKSFR